MGKLIKNHWARLIMLTAATCMLLPLTRHTLSLFYMQTYFYFDFTNKATFNVDQIGASIEGFIWPKIFWDFLTKSLDVAVKPFPILQIINLIFGIAMIALEWPLPLLAGTSVHRSIEFRLAILPLSALACLLMYQSTNPGLYYLVGMGAYFWAFSEGEVCLAPLFS